MKELSIGGIVARAYPRKRDVLTCPGIEGVVPTILANGSIPGWVNPSTNSPIG